VEDDSDLRYLNAEVLKQSGYQVDTAEDGASGWRALNARRYDVLITDHTMPRVTGLDLIKKLRSEEMQLSVILATGTVPTEELSRYPWLQLDAMLLKPYAAEEMLETVKKVLRETDGSAAESRGFRSGDWIDTKSLNAGEPASIPFRC
jgi:DNA-binding response OmpR family regulator